MKVKLLLFEVESPIVLRSPIISGSTLLHAIYSRLIPNESSNINVSTLRLSVPYQNRGRMVSTKEIKVSTYSEIRDWRDGRPVEGQTEVVSKLDIQFGERFIDDTTHMIISNEGGFVKFPGKESEKDLTRNIRATAYVHGAIPDDSIFKDISIGAKRNLGYGRLNLLDSLTLETNDIEIDVESKWIRLMSPYCLESTFPGTDGENWPSWWSADGWRNRNLKLFHQGRVHDLRCVDEDQVFANKRASQDPWKGVSRIGNHKKYGFGEWYFAG